MKLMVIDGNSIINRSFYGIRPLSTRDGLYTHAVFGFLTTLLRLKEEEKIAKIIAAQKAAAEKSGAAQPAQAPATTFGPEDMITREQMAAILFRYAQGKGMASITLEKNLETFTDAGEISAYAVDAMNWAVGQGLINGMGDGTVAPQGQAIRAQAAAILHRFCETLELI